MLGVRFRQNLLLIAAAAVAFVPFCVGIYWIRRSFWFGDDFAFMADIDHLGFLHWWPQQFGENYIPLFKLLWAAVLFGGGGSSLVALAVNWATHAINTVLFVRLLRSAQFSNLAAFAAAAAFAIAVSNIEVLTWSMGWSTILACTFLLLALNSEASGDSNIRPKTFRTAWWIFAGTLTHARGIVGGPAAAAMALMPSPRNSPPWNRRWKRAICLLIPSVLTGTAIFLLAPANHHEVLSNFSLATRGLNFGFWYFAGNPFVPLFSANAQSWTSAAITTSQITILGAAKVLLILAAIRGSSGERRVVIIGLVTADLFTAALLGIGRSSGDASLAMSSRYQYGSLLCNLPVAFAAGSAFLRQIQLLRNLRPIVLWGAVAVTMAINLVLWQRLLPAWTNWRSEGTRSVLSSTENPNGHDLPGAGFITNSEGRRLSARYHLH